MLISTATNLNQKRERQIARHSNRNHKRMTITYALCQFSKEGAYSKRFLKNSGSNLTEF